MPNAFIHAAVLAISLGLLGCDADAPPDDARDAAPAVPDLDLRTPGYDGCTELVDADACAAVGCRWLEATALHVDADSEVCEPGTTIGMCYPTSAGQPCTPSDSVCDDGTRVWALWGPDGGVLVTRSSTSCGVVEGFEPCVDDPDASAEQALACACACDLEVG